MRVLVIPEDPLRDQFILRPIVTRLFADLGRPAKVDILSRPRIRGVDQALSRTELAKIADSFRMIDLFLVLVDRDGVLERAVIARAREEDLPGRLFVCLAVEEVEVWMLALHRDNLGVPWSTVRSEKNPKELFAQPFIASRIPKVDLSRGLSLAMRELGAGWKGLLQVCPELQELKDRIRGWLDTRQPA